MSVKNLNSSTAGFNAVMGSTPWVRKEEYVNLVEGLTHTHDMHLLDFGAGEGFLDDYLPYFVNIHKHRLELPYSGKVFRKNAKLNIKSFSDRFDAVVCLATAHQLNAEQKTQVWEECYRVLKPGGELVIQDVGCGSKTERFLNNFVSIHKADGYSCFGLSKQDKTDLGRVGFVTKDKSPINVSWWASTEEALTEFCMQLFELDGIVDFETLRDSLKHFLGIKPWTAGVKMAWPMQRIVLRKPG